MNKVNILVLAENYSGSPLEAMLSRWGTHCNVIEDEQYLLSNLADAASIGQPYDVAMIDHDTLHCAPELVSRAIRENSELRGLDTILIKPDQEQSDDPVMVAAGYSSVLHLPVQESLLFNALHASSIIHHSADVISMNDLLKRKMSLKPLDILLAEDNPVNQEVAIEILKRSGHKVDVANDGEEALDALAGEKEYDLVLLDMNMPKVSGLDVLKHFRFMDTSASVPVLMLSADALPETVNECLEAGANDYLTKPIRASVLLEKVAEYSGLLEEDESRGSDSGPRSQPGGSELLDEVVLSELFSLVHAYDKREHLIGSFQSSGLEHLEQLRLASEENNRQEYLLIIHAFKGSAGALGVKGVSSICKEVETTGGGLCQSDMVNFNRKLDHAFRQGCEALHEYLQQA